MTDPRADRLRQARLARGYAIPTDAISVHGWPVGSYYNHENGNTPFSFKKAKAYAEAYRVRVEWLYEGKAPMREGDEALARIMGTVGAASDGEVIMETAHERWDYAPLPPGAEGIVYALEVKGGSMPGIAEDGALLYFEEQVTKPAKDMLGRIVIVETADGRVLVKRLMRGSEKGLYDLESLVGQTIEDVRLNWAAHITAIIPPHQAQKIIRRCSQAA